MKLSGGICYSKEVNDYSNLIGWQIIQGQTPLLVCASHRYLPTENPPRDLEAGKIAESFCKTESFWGIIGDKAPLDIHWYSISNLRFKIKEIIKFYKIKSVIDLHGRRTSNFNLVDFYPNLQFQIKFRTLLAPQSVRQLETDFLGMAADLEKENIPCLEVEIRKDGKTEGTQTYKIVCELLQKFVKDIKRTLAYV